jgi:hypothetical protein
MVGKHFEECDRKRSRIRYYREELNLLTAAVLQAADNVADSAVTKRLSTTERKAKVASP